MSYERCSFNLTAPCEGGVKILRSYEAFSGVNDSYFIGPIPILYRGGSAVALVGSFMRSLLLS